jgi:predicted TIM-barrel fold metal-dependent hydrolase
VLIVDSQVHIWGADSPERPWPAGRGVEAQRPYPVDAESLLLQMDLAGVDRVVLVPPSWEGDRNDLALAAARAHPDRFAVMGRLALQDPASRSLVGTWREQPGMLGMRFTFHNQFNRHFLTDGTADWLWPAAERAGIPLMVLVPGSLHLLDEIAARHPGLKLVIDHVGLAVRGTAPAVFDDLPAVCALAKHPNVAVKASGMPALSADGYPFRDLHAAIEQLVESFGPRRVFWGTDLTRMPCTYYECIHLFTDNLPWLRGEDLEWVMGRGVCEWLGWDLPPAPRWLV